MASRFELLHSLLSSARRLVRILPSVVQSFVLAVLDAGHDLPLRNAVAGKLVGDHDARRPHLLLQQLAQQPLGRVLVASALDQSIENNPGLVQRSPQPVLHTGDLKCYLIQIPFVARLGKTTTDPVGRRLAEAGTELLSREGQGARVGDPEVHALLPSLSHENVRWATGWSGLGHSGQIASANGNVA